MIGVGTLTVGDVDIILSGVGTLTIYPENQVTMTGVGSLSVEADTNGGSINVTLPALLGKLSDFDFGAIDLTLPALTGELVEEYVPLATEGIYGNLPPLVFSGMLTTISGGDINVNLPALLGKLSDFDFGEINVDLPALVSNIYEDQNPGVGECMSIVYSADYVGSYMEHVVFINEAGLVVGTITASKLFTQAVVEAVNSSSAMSLIGEYVAYANSTVLSSGAMSSNVMVGVLPKPSLDETTRVWVVNIDTGASWQYEGYGFNSLFTDDETGECFGVADDGIYKIGGDDDAGFQIDAFVDLGKSDLGTPHRKKIPNVYAGVSSDGKMLLKVKADGQEYVYEARSSSTDMKNHRFDIGKGLAGNYYNLTMLNQNGDDFDLETISFDPVILKGKI